MILYVLLLHFTHIHTTTLLYKIADDSRVRDWMQCSVRSFTTLLSEEQHSVG